MNQKNGRVQTANNAKTQLALTGSNVIPHDINVTIAI